MKLLSVVCLLLVANLFEQKVIAQDSLSFKVVKISPGDFTINPAIVDSSSNALVLADIGSSEIIGTDEGIRVVYKRFRRIRVLNKRGFEIAVIKLHFSAEENGGRKLKSLKASTYNLENGQIVQTPLSNKDFFLDKPEGDRVEGKFTFPNVKEGSIIEYTYSIRSSDYFELPSWRFQGDYPILSSTTSSAWSSAIITWYTASSIPAR